MTERPKDFDALRERFLSRAGEAPGGRCPAVERIWAAAGDELPHGEFRDLVEHAASCPACAAAWRLARDLATEDRPAEAPAPIPEARTEPVWRWRRFAPVAAAAAAIALVAVLVAYRAPWRPAPVSPYRTQKAATIRSLIPDDAVLSRRDCALRWSPGPAGATYNVRVTDADLAPLASAVRLDREQFAVPEAALARVASGQRILWQVVAVLPGGREVVSPTFAVRIE